LLIFRAGSIGYFCLRHTRTDTPLLNFDVERNPFKCDCKDYEIISFAQFYGYTHSLDRANCGEPPDLYTWKVCPFRFSTIVYNKKLCYCRGTARRACQYKSCNYKTSHLKWLQSTN